MIVENVKVEGWNLVVAFSDGTVKQVDARDFFKEFYDQPSAKRLQTDINFLKQVRLEDGIALTWPTGFTADPFIIYEEGVDAGTHKAAGNLAKALRKISVERKQ